jgi:hypothetical protein
MKKNEDELWKGIYYPKEFIENKRTLTLLCLLFDKITCHFPVSHMACGGGHGMSEDLFGENLLVKAGVIELEEEYLLHEVDESVKDWPTDVVWPKDFSKYIDLQIAGMAIRKSEETSFVPVTDNKDFRVPALILNKFDIMSNAKLQAVAGAVSCIDMVLPPVIGLEDEDILRLREELEDELIPFRRSMLGLAPQIRNYLDEGASVRDVYREAKYVIDTSVRPALDECKVKMEQGKNEFWRKILLKAGGSLPKFVMNWAEKSLISAAVDSMKDIVDLGVSAINNDVLFENMRRQGGFGFLLSLEEKIKKH